jgi:restriction endonuclease Mrr
MGVQIIDDILDFNGNTFDIEQILSVISNYLSLECLENDENLEFQISLDIELEYNNIEKSDYELLVFTIKDFEYSEELTNEITQKVKECDIDKLKELVIDELVKQHKDNHFYTGFSLIIKENYFSCYEGSGHDNVDGLKQSLENQIIDIDIDFTKLGID